MPYANLLLALLPLVFVASLSDDSSTPLPASPFNYVLGTQTIGATYHFFDNMTVLEETALAIANMGSNMIKIKSDDDPEFKVMDMDFLYTFIWWRSTSTLWFNGLSEQGKQEEYSATYAFASKLLTRYNNSGRSFFVGHWEGDWYLLPGYNASLVPSDTTLQGMVDWLNTRQKAVDDAKKAISHTNVNVWCYTEVNRVRDAMEGLRRIANDVLPHTNIDYVSYSSYDMQNLNQTDIDATFDYLAKNIPPKSGIPGKRLWIGEFGISETNAGSPLNHEKLNREIIIKYLNWGPDFILFWEMYNNEIDKNGNQVGFWLINNKNEKQPLYFTFQKLYTNGAIFVTTFNQQHGRNPTAQEYTTWAASYLATL